MPKNNNKKHRTDGAVISNNSKYANPLNSKNSPLSDYSYTDADKIARVTQENKNF